MNVSSKYVIYNIKTGELFSNWKGEALKTTKEAAENMAKMMNRDIGNFFSVKPA